MTSSHDVMERRIDKIIRVHGNLKDGGCDTCLLIAEIEDLRKALEQIGDVESDMDGYDAGMVEVWSIVDEALNKKYTPE